MSHLLPSTQHLPYCEGVFHCGWITLGCQPAGDMSVSKLRNGATVAMVLSTRWAIGRKMTAARSPGLLLMRTSAVARVATNLLCCCHRTHSLFAFSLWTVFWPSHEFPFCVILLEDWGTSVVKLHVFSALCSRRPCHRQHHRYEKRICVNISSPTFSV